MSEQAVRVKVGPEGRVVIPASFRSALGIRPGGTVIMRMEGDKLVLETPAAAVREIREHLAKVVPPGTSVVDELIAERREAARREAKELGLE